MSGKVGSMTGIWSTIKSAAPGLGLHHESPPPTGETSTAQSGSPSRKLGTSSSSRSLPRPPSSLDARATTTRSQATSSSQAHPPSPSTKSPSALSRNNTSNSTVLTSRARGKDRNTEDKNAAGAGTIKAAAIESTANGTTITTTTTTTGSSADEARQALSSTDHTPGSNFGIDPLSQHIFRRKNTESSIPQRLTQMAEGLTRASSEITRTNTVPVGEAARDKSNRKGGGSFLSRLGMRPGKKKDLADFDSDSEFGSEARIDGINARVFSQTLGSPLVGGGYVPHHKEPPRYIRTRSSNKRTKEFNRVFLAQELVGTRPPDKDEETAAEAGKAPVVSVSVAGAGDRKTVRSGGAIWASEFSNDGRFLATGGRDHVVRVWAVLSTAEERRGYEEDEVVGGDASERLSAPVFREQPVMEFKGHTGEVLDLSWSKNNFLLSSSMDKTVRLWHMSRSECLCTFKHKDFVTRLAFHPRDDRFFLAGSLDTMLRLWSIPDKAVAFSAQLPDLVTAVAFSPDGKVAIAGLLNGYCMFYETEGLKLTSQIHVRSSRGKNAKGSKITGIQTMTIPPPNPLDAGTSHTPASTASGSTAEAETNGTARREEVRVLITSNDSRIRVYNLHDKSLLVKLKGHENTCSQIAATFSDDGKHIICGSEDRKTFIWNVAGDNTLVQDKDKPPCEYFDAHGDIVTTALFAPTKTRMLLGQSGDPIYDLCNPPPVVLQSLEEAASAANSQVALASDSQQNNRSHEQAAKRPEPSPAYIARSTHYDGQIIVTTGDTGIIKVFRQDCAYAKRRHESWETGSTFSRKLGTNGGFIGGGLGRSGSVLTRTSASSTTAHSRRGSLSQPVPPSVLGSPQFHAVNAYPDRILSWRQGIEHNGDRRSVLLADGTSTPARSERSLSPAKASRTSLNSAYLASEGRKQPYSGLTPARNRASSALPSPTANAFSSPPGGRRSSWSVKEGGLTRQQRRNSKPQEVPSSPPTPGFTLYSASAEGDDRSAQPDSAAAATTGTGSTSFWNLSRLRAITAFKATGAASSQGGARTRTKSTGSRPSLSISRQNTDIVSGEKDGNNSGGQIEEEEGVRDDVGGGDIIAATRQQSTAGDTKSHGRKSHPGGSSVQESSGSETPTGPVKGGDTKNHDTQN